MMRFAKRFPFVARSWLLGLLALAFFASGLAAAQAPVTTTSVSADLLLALLGSGTAIEIGLPDDVRVVHVVATRGEAVIEQRAEIIVVSNGRAESIVVSVGAVGPTLRCPMLVFIHTSLEGDGRGFGGGMNASCIEIDVPAAMWPTHRGFLGPSSIEVDTWYAVHGFLPAELGAGGPRPSPDDAIVFHVYLATAVGAAPIEELTVGPR